MQYDQSWMGYGIVGGLQAGLIAAVVAALLFGFFHWLGRRGQWSYGPQIGWTFLSATLLTASGDLWNLFYFNYARLQSLQLLRAKLALVHDPDGIGVRVLCEFVGAGVGIAAGWLMFAHGWRRQFRDRRQ
jgi:hypothetical protein